ncbi:MAG: hypothetical protein COA88_02560 [Kordia sp.]|nr:MAG: hypothetical protein COA88_02560 [Kordia sp.]
MAAFAQAPQKMSYQAVVRDAANGLIANQMVGMQISVLQGSDTGTPVYIETQTPTTNANGLASLEIGTGNIVSGTFASIDWSTGTYYIKTETDLAGGNTYTISGASQLLSVPYALYAGGSNGGLSDGAAAGNTPYWNGTSWVTNSSNIFNNGANVGINTPTPERILEVHSNVTYSAGQTASLMLSDNFQKWNLGLGYQPAKRFSISTQDQTERFVITETGNIGIGIITPLAKLDVAGQIKITDGTHGAGKVLTSDANGLATWTTPGAASAPYHHFTGTAFGQTMSFPVGNSGAIITLALLENCLGSRTVGGMIFYDPISNEVMIMNSSGGNTGGAGLNSITAAANVLTLNNGCVPMTFTFTVTSDVVTITVGGDPNGIMESKWTVLGI